MCVVCKNKTKLLSVEGKKDEVYEEVGRSKNRGKGAFHKEKTVLASKAHTYSVTGQVNSHWQSSGSKLSRM